MVAIAKFLLLALPATATPLIRSVQDVISDLQTKISPQVITLNADVVAFPASGVNGAATIHTDIQTLTTTLSKATTTIEKTGSFGAVYGVHIANLIQGQVSGVVATLVAFASQKISWEGMPGGTAQLRVELQDLGGAFDVYADAAIAATPLVSQVGLITVKLELSAAFATAIAVFS